MTMPLPLRTSLGTSTSDSITLCGYDLCSELIGRVDFGDLAFLLVAGKLPTPSQSKLFNAVLVALADHGLTPSAIAARLTYTGAPESLQGAVASGLLGAGDVFLGSLEKAAQLLQAGVTEASGSDDATLRTTAVTMAADLTARHIVVAGLGHPIHRTADPRTTRLFALADEVGLLGPHIRLLRFLADAVNCNRSHQLPINAAGAAGAVLSDLGIDWHVVRGVALIARAAGLVAHIREEREYPISRRIWDRVMEDVPYVTPNDNR
jgi:citrate synthase